MAAIIRKATTSDVESIRIHMQSVYDDETDMHRFPYNTITSFFIEEILNDPLSLFLLAESEGNILGMLYLWDRGEVPGTVELAMSVAWQWRNKGIGKQLLKAAVDWANQATTVKAIDLDVFQRNEPAFHLYKSFGFKLEEPARRMTNQRGELLDIVRMSLSTIS